MYTKAMVSPHKVKLRMFLLKFKNKDVLSAQKGGMGFTVQDFLSKGMVNRVTDLVLNAILIIVLVFSAFITLFMKLPMPFTVLWMLFCVTFIITNLPILAWEVTHLFSKKRRLEE